jgi:hypothetical protein
VSQIPVGEQAAHLANTERVGCLPEHVHYGALKLPKSVHRLILPWDESGPADEDPACGATVRL